MPFKRVKLVTISPSQIHPTLLPLTMLNCSFIVSVHYRGGGGGGGQLWFILCFPEQISRLRVKFKILVVQCCRNTRSVRSDVVRGAFTMLLV